MSRGIVSFYGFNKAAEQLLLDEYTTDRAYSLRKLRSDQTFAIRVRRASDNTDLDIGFVGEDLDETAIVNFCGASNGAVLTFYDQSGGSNNATHSTGTISAFQSGKIYDSSTGLVKRGGKPAVQFISGTQYDFTNLTNTNSIFFVAENTTNSPLNYIVHGSTGDGITINTNYWNPKFGTVYVTGGEFGRGLSFLSGRNLGSFVYSATASLYMMNRNGGADTFGDIFGGSQNSSTTLPRFQFNKLGRAENFLSINGFFQEVILGASVTSNINLSNKNDVITNINNYWSVY